MNLPVSTFSHLVESPLIAQKVKLAKCRSFSA